MPPITHKPNASIGELESEFERRLGVFRRQVDDVARCLYAEATIHVRARANAGTLRALQSAPAFWNTVSGGLLTAAIVGIGRIFDPNQRNHSVDTLLGFAMQHREVFSKDALAGRKRRTISNAEKHLPAIRDSAHVPTVADFRRLRRQLNRHRQTYYTQFKDIRHRHFAHTAAVDLDELHAMFGKTRVRDLERAVVFLNQLESALWHLFHNGRKPRLSPMPWSVRSLARRPYDDRRRHTTQEEAVSDTKACLRLYTKGAAAPATRRRRARPDHRRTA